MFRFVMRTLLVACAIGAICGEAKAEPKKESAKTVSNAKQPSAKIIEVVALARVVYEEARSESLEGQIMIAQSVMNRVRANKSYWCGNKVSKVVHCAMKSKKGRLVRQYDGIKGAWKPKDKLSEKIALDIAVAMISDTKIMKGPLKDVDHYINPDTSSKENVCWFKQNLVFIQKIGKHEAYRTPRPIEKKILETQPLPEECKNTKQVANR